MGILEEYKSCLCTIRQLSWDKERKQSLIDDDEKSHKMYNFDGIKKKCVKGSEVITILHVMLIGRGVESDIS